MSDADRRWLLIGIAGVLLYVATWAVLGAVADGYDPLRQAISELFDLGVSTWQRRTLAGVLLVTGVALVRLGPVLGRVLPGRGRLGPGLIVAAGVGTALVAFFPCTAGCPGVGSTFTDTMHVVTAGGGYLGLVTAPIAFWWRLRPTSWGALGRAGLVLGGLATAGFLLRNVGPDVLPGLQQRVFNTLADAWLVTAAVVALRHHSRSAPDRHSSTAATTP